MGEESAKNGKPYVGLCHAGLIDFAAPIMVRGHHLGTVLGGQIVDKEISETKVRNVAREINTNADKLWDAAQKIDIVQKRNIEAAAEVLFIVVNALAEEGYRQLEIKHLSKELADNFIQISDTVDMLASSAQSITFDQQSLTEQIKDISITTEKVTTVLKSIEQIANNIKMIGLNASIEAARLGEVGKGFAVVAKEIQNLSQKSKATTAEINKMNEQINHIVDKTLEKADSTLKTTEDQSAAMEELSATTQNITTLAERLKELS
jgi:methyl-accepting chemotaxis protein